MESRFVKEDNNSYIEIYPDSGDAIPPYITGMLCNNAINGLLDMHTQCVNNRIAYHYNTKGLASLKDVGESGKCGTDVILDILRCLDKTLDSLDEYFLDHDGIVTEPQYIMWNHDERKAYFVYAPGDNISLRVKLRKLFEYYMEHMQYGRREDTIRFYEAYQNILKNDMTVLELADMIQGSYEDIDNCEYGGTAQENEDKKEFNDGFINSRMIGDGTQNKTRRHGRYSADNIDDGTHVTHISLMLKGAAVVVSIFLILSQVFSSSFPVRIPMIAAIVLMAVPAAMYTMSSRMGKTKHVQNMRAEAEAQRNGQTGQTAYAPLDSAPVPAASIPDAVVTDGSPEDIYSTRRLCNGNSPHDGSIAELWHDDDPDNGRLIIDKVPCVIGRHGMEADLFIDDMHVSRMHAQISIENEELVIRDLYSKNGTYINEMRLIPNQPATLNNGDVIRFAQALYRVVNSNPI